MFAAQCEMKIDNLEGLTSGGGIMRMLFKFSCAIGCR